MVTHRMGSVLLAVALLGCTTDATEPVGLPTFEWPVGVSVTSWHGDPPGYIYDWTDGRTDSKAEVLTVTRLSDPEEVVWEIIDDSGSGIRPVVLHGTVPEGATATVDVEPNLTPGSGTRYRVTVELKDGQTGSTEFTT
jgi:hypothetical protein